MAQNGLCSMVRGQDAKVACRILQRKKKVWLSDLVAEGMSIPRANRALDYLIRRGIARPVR